MKTRTTLAALVLLTGMLCACTSPFGQNDTFRQSQGVAMQGQMAAHQQASLAMAGRQMRALAPMHTIPVRPVQPFNSYTR